MALRTGTGPRRTVSACAVGLAASAVLTLYTAPAGPSPTAPEDGPGVTTTASAAPGTGSTTAPAVAPGPPSIGPGTVTETAGAGLCTAGFVLAAGDRTFLAQAAHCGGTPLWGNRAGRSHVEPEDGRARPSGHGPPGAPAQAGSYPGGSGPSGGAVFRPPLLPRTTLGKVKATQADVAWTASACSATR